MKKVKAIILFSLLGILSISPAFAMDFPKIAGITVSKTTTAAEFIIYLFNLAIASGAFIAAVVLIMAGVDYVSSKGEPAKIQSAKNKIKNAILGLTILLASFMILNIINPQLTSIKIDKLGKTADKEIVIPEGTGVYLYDSPNYVSTGDPLRVTETMANFSEKKFNKKVQSIKFVNPTSDFKFGAVIFAENTDSELGSGFDLRGNCSFVLNSIPDLDVASGNENKPAIGKNKLSSILLFKTKDGGSSVKLYNNINCKKRSEEYGKQKEEENECTINSSGGFANIKDVCPKFKGDIFSIETSGDVGVLLKASEKEVAGRCQFLESNNSGCINTVKSSYVYSLNIEKYSPSVVPLSFMLFPLVK
jgi:hypothetical protein